MKPTRICQMDVAMMEKLKRVNLVKSESIRGVTFASNKLSEDSALFRVERVGPSRASTGYMTALGIACAAAAVAAASLVNRLASGTAQLVVSICIILLGTVLFNLYRRAQEQSVTAEGMVVVKGMGIQLFSETLSGELRNLQFIDTTRIKDVLIVEGLTALKVLVYLAIELVPIPPAKRAPKLILPFKHLEVPSKWLVEIAKGTRKTLALLN